MNRQGAGGPVTGSIRTDGKATAQDNSSAFASSFSRLSVQGGTLMKNGRIMWGPVLSSMVTGNARVGKKDPIDFRVTDLLTSSVLTGELLDITSDMLGPGTFSWDSSTFTVSARDFDFLIDMNSPYTVQKGTLNLRISGGKVTTSSATGIFAGIFPGVGSSGTFSVPFGSLTLDYDLGNFGSDPLSVNFDFGNSGTAVAGPEPSSLTLFGTTALALLGYGLRDRLRLHAKRRTSSSSPVNQTL